MGVFKRRAKTEGLLRGHLERLGLSPVWLQSAKDAIRHCEKGEYFQPIFSVAGPAPARSVLALMRLEPFVRREIDWSVSPSESPFWVGFVGELKEELFSDTARHFVSLYWSDRNPSIATDLETALGAMINDVARSLEGSEQQLDAEASRCVRALGSAGYVWRVAESRVQSGDLNLRADLAKEVEAVVRSSPTKEASRDRLLAWAASECVRRNLLFGSGSPGGWASGGEFLRRGFRFADRHVASEGTMIPHSERWYAFVFGIALYDVHECVLRNAGLELSRFQPAA